MIQLIQWISVKKCKEMSRSAACQQVSPSSSSAPRLHEGRPTEVVAAVHFDGLLLQQHLHGAVVPRGAGQVQRRAPVVVPGVGVGAELQQTRQEPKLLRVRGRGAELGGLRELVEDFLTERNVVLKFIKFLSS